ncbi:hypothetical protein ACTD5D_19135 [Nocardia takedensis]|uniref:hypothetical protein n=1 Tax=Nocardia takedensis TaxID=259390 RepID=UPI0003076402|nr:hypothetical protein [Nocardia takedensis]
MTVLPTASEADRVEQDAFVDAADRDVGPDFDAVRVDAPGVAGLDSADPADRFEQAWSTPRADDDDRSLLAY